MKKRRPREGTKTHGCPSNQSYSPDEKKKTPRGDENLNLEFSVQRSIPIMKKRRPREGTKTFLWGLLSSSHCLWKKEDPERGRKPLALALTISLFMMKKRRPREGTKTKKTSCHLMNSPYYEKKKTPRGDENGSPVRILNCCGMYEKKKTPRGDENYSCSPLWNTWYSDEKKKTPRGDENFTANAILCPAMNEKRKPRQGTVLVLSEGTEYYGRWSYVAFVHYG